MRAGTRLLIALACSGSAAAQTPNGRPLPRDPREQADALVRTQLTDTAFIQRAVALHLLGRASRDVRQHAEPLLTAALSSPAQSARIRALAGLDVLGAEAVPAVNAIILMASNARDAARQTAIRSLARMGPIAAAAIPALRVLGADSLPFVRLSAANALLGIGDTASAQRIYRGELGNSVSNVRLTAARSLAELGDAAAVPALRTFLRDTVFRVQTQAAIALGMLGPKGGDALDELLRMVRDTAMRRIPQGQAWEYESAAPYAAWAVSQLLPFRASGSNQVSDPLHARVVGDGNALRDDGLGVYAWGVDSVAVFRGSGLFLMLSSAGEARGPIGAVGQNLRRSLTFDLSSPVQGAGAKPLGVVSDKEAYVWVWFRRDPKTDHVSTFRELGVSDSVHVVERIEMHFRIGGVLHELQMGPFVEGQGGAAGWFTGVHGNGTTLGTIAHPSAQLWIVRAAAGSRARLWSFENRAQPVDRGLYTFPLEIRFTGLPGGASGACVPSPSSC